MTNQEIATALSKLYANAEPLTLWAPREIFTVLWTQLPEIPFRTGYSASCPVRIDVPVYGSEVLPDPDYPGQMKRLETLLGHQLEIEYDDPYAHARGFWKDDSLCFCAEILYHGCNPYRISADWLENYSEPFKAFDVRAESWEDALRSLRFQVKERLNLASKVQALVGLGRDNG
jgi:hypothetical protein